MHELWFDPSISTLCGGYMHLFLSALEANGDLAIHQQGARVLNWTVEWSHLVLEERQAMGQPQWLVQHEEGINLDAPSDVEEDAWIPTAEQVDGTGWGVTSKPLGGQTVAWGENACGSGWSTAVTEDWSTEAWRENHNATAAVWG